MPSTIATAAASSAMQKFNGLNLNAPLNLYSVQYPYFSYLNTDDERMRLQAYINHNSHSARMLPLAALKAQRVRGIYNATNTCYIHSVIQCLFALPDVWAYLASHAWYHHLNRDGALGTRGRLLTECVRLARSLTFPSISRTHNPITDVTLLKACIAELNEDYEGSEQHDAHEFLIFLLDKLHEDTNLVRKKQYVEYTDLDSTAPDATNVRIAIERHHLREISFFDSLFRTTQITRVQCIPCQHISVTVEFVSVHSLALPAAAPTTKKRGASKNTGTSSTNVREDDTSVITLEQCLKEATAREKLTADDEEEEEEEEDVEEEDDEEVDFVRDSLVDDVENEAETESPVSDHNGKKSIPRSNPSAAVKKAKKKESGPLETRCDHCNSRHIPMTRQTVFHFETLPPYLIFHLKRFEWDESGQSSIPFSYYNAPWDAYGGNRGRPEARKIKTPVQYPILLDMRPYCSERDHQDGSYHHTSSTVPSTSGSGSKLRKDVHQQQGKYRLIGVVLHSGKTACAGHYTCYARLPMCRFRGSQEAQQMDLDDCAEGMDMGGEQWFSFNDELVTPIVTEGKSEEAVQQLLVHPNAYMLLYEHLHKNQ